jgi:uncharacterized protein
VEPLIPTPLTTLKRRPQRGSYDRAVVHAILDEALVCHLGFVADGQPIVTPTMYGRIGDRLYLHGALANRMLRSLADGIPMCVTVTLLDGLVLTRSAFHHSMNYRSVMLFGVASVVTDVAERMRALAAIVNHMVPGRFDACRHPSAGEIKATCVLSLPIAEASAKVRAEPAKDSDEDCTLPYWAGVIPMKLQALAPEPDPALPATLPTPPAVARYRRSAR